MERAFRSRVCYGVKHILQGVSDFSSLPRSLPSSLPLSLPFHHISAPIRRLSAAKQVESASGGNAKEDLSIEDTVCIPVYIQAAKYNNKFELNPATARATVTRWRVYWSCATYTCSRSCLSCVFTAFPLCNWRVSVLLPAAYISD